MRTVDLFISIDQLHHWIIIQLCVVSFPRIIIHTRARHDVNFNGRLSPSRDYVVPFDQNRIKKIDVRVHCFTDMSFIRYDRFDWHLCLYLLLDDMSNCFHEDICTHYIFDIFSFSLVLSKNENARANLLKDILSKSTKKRSVRV